VIGLPRIAALPTGELFVPLDRDAEAGDRVTRRPKFEQVGTVESIAGGRAKVKWDNTQKPQKVHVDDLVPIED